MKPDMPISLMLTLAMLGGDRTEVDRVVNKCFSEIGHELMKVVNSYDFVDLPFVVAAMRITASSPMPIMDKSGQQLVERLTSMTTAVTIDADEMRRQAGETDNGKYEKQ